MAGSHKHIQSDKKQRRSFMRCGLFVFFFLLALIVGAGLLLNESPNHKKLAQKTPQPIDERRPHIDQPNESKEPDQFTLPDHLPDDLKWPPLDLREKNKSLKEHLEEKKLTLGSPVYMRIFKAESRLELWMKKGKTYELLTNYKICTWSGDLGPKQKEGDKQSPEGFYYVAKGALNPKSKFYRSFNLGYPNRFDRAHKRTGSYLMVHGGCASIGCYAMTDEQMKQIWALITAAFDKGQRKFAVHIFPFEMTKENLDFYKDHKWISFWQQLTPAYELFNKDKQVPKVSVCKKQYKVRPGDEMSGQKSDLTLCPSSSS